jgi:hypothetical protein
MQRHSKGVWNAFQDGPSHGVYKLRQFLVILHAARVVDIKTKMSAEQRYSVVSMLEAATATVNLHTALTASSNLALCCARCDYYRAALLVCHVAYYASKSNGKLSRVSHEYVANEGPDSMMAQVVKVAFDSCLHEALRLQEERVMLVGRGGQQHWVLSGFSFHMIIPLQKKPSLTMNRCRDGTGQSTI